MRISESGKAKLRDVGLLVVRVGAGGMMLIAHGVPKLAKFGDDPLRFADPLGIGVHATLGLAVFSEALCALALVVGLLTRLAAIPLVVTMAVAAFVVHAGDPFGERELALVYALPFVLLVFTGPGRYSLDARVLPRP